MRRALAAAAALSLVLPATVGGAAGERGGPGPDRVKLGPGPDRFFGAGGADAIAGGRGADRLSGGPGADTLRGGPGRDALRGGPGRDVCVADRADRPPRGCEVVRGRDAAPAPEAPHRPGISDAFANRNWQPTPYDTCPRALHESYSVVGPDRKLYPGWHPSAVTDPASGAPCTFGHEHGADPSESDIHDWVAAHMAAPGFGDRAGIPFGYVSEALSEYADANPGTPMRFEDHVGHKVEYVNDVDLLDTDGGYVTAPGPSGPERVTCDYLLKVHQGSHSPDAAANNVHELLYAVRCSDGTELISTTMARFGAANVYNRSCAPGTTVDNGSTSPYLPGAGARLIPDRGCVEQFVLVPPSSPSAASDIWALYENWKLDSELRTAGGGLIARFDPWFAVRNPSRYAWPGTGIGRTLDAAWETDAGDGGVANRPPWTDVGALGQFEYRDPRSPFDGAERDFYVRDTEVSNAGGPVRWWTDPYGENGSTAPFPGGICQLVSPTDNTAAPELRRRLFGRDTDYGGQGVHAPN